MSHEKKNRFGNKTIVFCATLFAVFFVCRNDAQAADYYGDYSDVLLVINDNSTDSVDIGNYFKTARSIPDGHVVHITCSTNEDTTLENFTNQIKTPIENFLTTNNLTDSINYIVTTKGIPLRDGMGSVDSDLTMLLGTYSSNIGQSGYISSPYTNKREIFSRQKFGIYLVTRLTGYTVADAEALVDRATAINLSTSPADRGPFILDTGVKTGSYQIGDDWMKAAAPILQNKGYNVNLELTTTYLTSQTNVGGYCSWGSNDGHVSSPYHPNNTYEPGALAETYVSTSARSFASGTTYSQSLIADWISEGVTGIKGYVQEPYLDSMAHPDILFDRYTGGFNLADSYYMASAYLGRMDLIVGDPKAHIFEDASAPTISSFSIPSTSQSKTVTISSLSATDTESTTASLAYLLTETATVPSNTDSNWMISVPATYSFQSAGDKTLYAWVMDSKGNISASESESVHVVDNVAPSVDFFDMPEEAASLTVNVSVSAQDDVGVSGYYISESSETPAAGGAGWVQSAPSSFTFSAAGTHTVYLWVKDAEGNVSAVSNQTVSVELLDTAAPTVSVFNIPSAVNTLTAPIALRFADNVGTAGYFLSESASTPAASDPDWQVSVPVSYTFATTGSKTLHAWAKDAAGNISAMAVATVSVTVAAEDSQHFLQANWTGGASNDAANLSNKAGWNKYGSLSSVAAGNNLQLSSGSNTITRTTDTDFNAGTFSSTETNGSGEAAGVGIIAPASTVLGANFINLPENSVGLPSYVFNETANNKLYFSDSHHRIIKVDSGEGGTVFGANFETFGAEGSGSGQFSTPYGIFVDSVNNKVYVVDQYNSRIVRMDSGGGSTTLGANFETFGSNGSGSGQFGSMLGGISTDLTNNKLYIADAWNCRVARMDSGSGGTTFGANFQSFGSCGSSSGQFTSPYDVQVNSAENKVYVADYSNGRIVKMDSGGGSTTLGGNFVTFGSSGSGYGKFSYPKGVSLDTANNRLYVADYGNNRVAAMDSGGGSTTLGGNFGSFGLVGTGTGQFKNPYNVYIDSTNNKLYVADYNNLRIVKMDSGGGGSAFGANFSSVFGNSGNGYFNNPEAVSLDKKNNKLYIADTSNSRIVRMDSGGGGTTYGANFQAFGSFGVSAGKFAYPRGIYVDSENNKLFISDWNNNRIVKMDSGGGSTTFGDNLQTFGSYGTGSGGFNYPSGIFLDSGNNKLYVVDGYNERVVKMDSGGGGTTFGGNFSSYNGMGSDFEDGFNFSGIFVDTSNNKVYVTDSGYFMIYEFDSGGASASIPGTNLVSHNCTVAPGGIFVDTAHNKLFYSDMNNGAIIKIDSGGGGTSYGANGETYGTSGVGSGQMSSPEGIFADIVDGKIYVADSGNNRVIGFDSGESTTYAHAGSYASDIINAGWVLDATLSWNTTGSPAISMKVRSGVDPADVVSKPWSKCTEISSGATLVSGKCSDADDKYVQYEATFTSDGSSTNQLQDVFLNYHALNTPGELVSSWFDSGSDNSVIESLKWGAATSAGNSVSLKLQTAPDNSGAPGSPSDWLGPDSTNATSFTHADGSDIITGNLGRSQNNRWMRWKISLTSDGSLSPVVSDVLLGFMPTDNVPPSNPGGLVVQ